MKLSVTEAAVLNRNLLFKIESLDLNIEPIFRSYPQIAWLHQKLTATFPDLIIPPLFQAPDPNLIAISDNNHIEQKRLQADRYFSKISSRHQITDNSDFKYFATQMVPSDTLEERKHLIDLSFLSPIVNPIVGPLVNSNYERGFRIYRPAEDIEGNDQDIFLQRQAYILSLESHLNQVSFNLQEVIRIKRDLATSLGYLGDSLLSTLGNINTLLGSTITDRPAEVTSAFAKHEQFLKTVTALTDDLETIYERQSVNEQMHVGDVFQEYDDCINSVKVMVTEHLLLFSLLQLF
ncbi:hypothetical protein BKA69DRAFT_91484 [Paraphysoderma sedebokerense]|nr:hypothetical protein BKA69DRAFT_91484 [Paraphysoderma sedebokerense]